jgi:hypothetical protein
VKCIKEQENADEHQRRVLLLHTARFIGLRYNQASHVEKHGKSSQTVINTGLLEGWLGVENDTDRIKIDFH